MSEVLRSHINGRESCVLAYPEGTPSARLARAPACEPGPWVVGLASGEVDGPEDATHEGTVQAYS